MSITDNYMYNNTDNDINYINENINSPQLIFEYILSKKDDDSIYIENVSNLASVLREDNKLRRLYIKYIINNRHTFKEDNGLLTYNNIETIIGNLQELAVPDLQPLLLKPEYDKLINYNDLVDTDENNTEMSTVLNPKKTYQQNTEMSNTLNSSESVETKEKKRKRNYVNPSTNIKTEGILQKIKTRKVSKTKIPQQESKITRVTKKPNSRKTRITRVTKKPTDRRTGKTGKTGKPELKRVTKKPGKTGSIRVTKKSTGKKTQMYNSNIPMNPTNTQATSNKTERGFCRDITTDEKIDALDDKQFSEGDKDVLKSILQYFIDTTNIEEIKPGLVLAHANKSVIKVNPILAPTDYIRKYLNNTFKLSGTKKKIIDGYGIGSPSGSCLGAKGFSFENELVKNWNNGVEDDEMVNKIKTFLLKNNYKNYNNSTAILGKEEKRPLIIKDDGTIEIDNGSDGGGKKISDIIFRLNDDPTSDLFVSLKNSGRVTFLNSGITTLFGTSGNPGGYIKLGSIRAPVNSNNSLLNKGRRLLDYFGIDPNKFSDTFLLFEKYNPDSSKKHVLKSEIVDDDDLLAFENLKMSDNMIDDRQRQNYITYIKQAIGQNYLYVHKEKNQVSFIDDSYLDSCCSDITNVKYYYGGKKSDSLTKRVEIEVETQFYTFFIVIRNKSGGIYPTHLLCDYLKK